MKDEILIENLRQRIKFIPLSIDMVELGMKNKNKAKKSLGLEELLKDVTLLKIAVETLCNRNNRHNFLFTSLDEVTSTILEPIEEHSDKFPHES